MNKSKINIKVSLSSSNTMNYSFYGISGEEIDQLKTEFSVENYTGYQGKYAEIFYYPGLEVIVYLLEKFEATKNENYSRLLHRPCQELIPYFLKDGRVAVIGPSHSILYKSEKTYIQAYQKMEGILGKKKVPKKDFPIERINYLPSGHKIISQEIDPFVGDVLVKTLEPLDRQKYPYTPVTKTVYLVDENLVLEKNTSYKSFRLFQLTAFELLQEKRKIDHQLINDRKKGNVSDGYLNGQMCGRNYLGEEFISNVDYLVKRLPDLINAPTDLFDYSLPSLRLVEKYVFNHLITDAFSDKIFLPLLAYFGQCIIEKNKNYNAEWKMLYDETYQSWTPDVRIKGHFLDICDPILRMLDTRSDNPDSWDFLYSASQ